MQTYMVQLTRADLISIYICEEMNGATPKMVADRADMAPDYLGDRMRTLVDHGLLKKTDKTAGIYQPTERGREILSNIVGDDNPRNIPARGTYDVDLD